MSAASPSHVAFEDYVESEGSTDAKHEWCDGVVYALSRGAPEHARLTTNIGWALKNALGPDCRVYSPDAMLYVPAARLSTYADTSVVCGPLETMVVRKDGRSLGEAITNPAVIVEVLSESTERYDRDGKFQAYKRLPSLKEYVLIAQDERRIEVYRLVAGAEWSCETSGPGGSVMIHGAAIAVDPVYA